ncbi:MAG: tagatose 6-phosphate kinase [Verrucomicrobiota bacterium]|jgi:1-phosphofructokinase family hexose kinase
MHTLVVALNPSVDVEWHVPHVNWEEKNVLESERRWPGGKGVNVARWLKHLGGKPRLLLPLGGTTGAEMQRGLRRERIPIRTIPLRGTTRANVIVTTRAQGQLRFNPPGPTLSAADWRRVKAAVRDELHGAALMVLSGSLPRGVPVSAYRELMALADRAGVRVFLDCDGESFRDAVRARPLLVKPNEHELEGFCGRRLKGENALRRAAGALSEITGGWVLLSRGRAGALLLHSKDGTILHAAAPRSKARNTVGAGDAMLSAVAGEVVAGSTPVSWLRAGIAAGTALTRCAAGILPERSLIRKIAAAIKVSGSMGGSFRGKQG